MRITGSTPNQQYQIGTYCKLVSSSKITIPTLNYRVAIEGFGHSKTAHTQNKKNAFTLRSNHGLSTRTVRDLRHPVISSRGDSQHPDVPRRRITLSGRASNVSYRAFRGATFHLTIRHTPVSYPRISLLGRTGQHKVSPRIKARPSSLPDFVRPRQRTEVYIARTHIYFLLIWKTIR